jgi:hypothetical protein
MKIRKIGLVFEFRDVYPVVRWDPSPTNFPINVGQPVYGPDNNLLGYVAEAQIHYTQGLSEMTVMIRNVPVFPAGERRYSVRDENVVEVRDAMGRVVSVVDTRPPRGVDFQYQDDPVTPMEEE